MSRPADRSVVRTAVTSVDQARLRAKVQARDRGVLDRHEVRVRAVRALRGQLEHLRPERGQDERHRRVGRGRGVLRGVHRVQVGAHHLEGIAVVTAAHRTLGAWLTPMPSTKPPGTPRPGGAPPVGMPFGFTGGEVGGAWGDICVVGVGEESAAGGGGCFLRSRLPGPGGAGGNEV